VIFVYNKRGTLNRVNLAIRYGGICGALETKAECTKAGLRCRLALCLFSYRRGAKIS